jgi:hypothetical protein
MARILYRIALHHAGGYAVEVGDGNNIDRVKSGFRTEAEAAARVAEQANAARGADQWERQYGPPPTEAEEDL